LGNGCGQEEIKFITCPDLIAALFFTEPLLDHEALIITGAKPYSTYRGYGQDFEYVGEANPSAPSSEVIIAIDNIDFSAHNQCRLYTQQYIDREILKAYASFKNCTSKKIATGNWGGDALQVCINHFLLIMVLRQDLFSQGDCQLKMMIQWIAATMAQKELVYYCVGNATSANELRWISQKYRSTCAG
jgi:poly(ADP-ribose) glycohydrolase